MKKLESSYLPIDLIERLIGSATTSRSQDKGKHFTIKNVGITSRIKGAWHLIFILLKRTQQLKTFLILIDRNPFSYILIFKPAKFLDGAFVEKSTGTDKPPKIIPTQNDEN